MTMLIIVGVVVAVLVTSGKRLLDQKGAPILAWVLLIASAAMPIYIGRQAIEPGESFSSDFVYGEKESIQLEAPEPGLALMVTATLAEQVDEDSKDNQDKTAYALELDGGGWKQVVDGNFKRKSAKGGPEIDIQGGQGITDGSAKKGGKWGEDRQDRHDLAGDGPFEVRVTNWTGKAAIEIECAVVRPPLPNSFIWPAIVILSLLAVFVDTRHGTDRISGDIGLLAFFAWFLRDGITPLDDYQQVVFAIAASALVGGVAVGAVGAGAEKLWGRHRKPIEIGKGRKQREAIERAKAKAEARKAQAGEATPESAQEDEQG
jgi:hypothetical protein